MFINKVKKVILISFCVVLYISLIIPLFWGSLLVFLTGVWTSDRLIRRTGFNLLRSLDQFGNTILLGSTNETISSRIGRAIVSGKQKKFVNMLHFFIDKTFEIIAGDMNHCIDNIEDVDIRDELWTWIK
jgi:hypothetical protein